MEARAWIELQRSRLAQMSANRAAESLRLVNDLNTLVKLRVQGRGEDSQNRPFSPYSAGYEKRRAKAGFQINYVDFTRTGRLWANVQPLVISQTANSVTIQVSARDAENVRKLEGALAQPKASPRGQIIRPSREEIELVAALNRNRISKYI